MKSPARASRWLFIDQIPAMASGFVMLLGALAGLGWMADIAVLKSVMPHWATMKINTAGCFFLAGWSLWLLRAGPGSRGVRLAGRTCAAVVVLIGALTLVEYAGRVDLGFDQLGQTLAGSGQAEPGRMAEAAAFNFLLVGLTLLGLDWQLRDGRRPVFVLALLVAIIGLLAFTGYLYGVESLYAITPFSSMAVHTALGFVVLATGLLTARRGPGPLQLLTSDGLGGRLTRRLLPLAIGVPLIVGWLRLMGERAGFYGLEFGTALFAVSNVLIFTVLIWRSAWWVDQADGASRESERRHLELIESLPQLVWTCRADGPCDYLSPQWVAYTGIPETPQLGYGWVEQLHPDDRQRAIGRWQETAGRGLPLSVEFRIRRHDGVYRWFDARAEPLRDPAGRIVKWFGTNTDIDDRKQTEQALAQETRRRQVLLESAQEGIFILNHHFQVIEANASFAAMLGCSMTETLQLHPWDWDVIYPTEKILRATWPDLPASPVRFETQIRHKNGMVLQVEISGSPVATKPGDERLMLFICRDITERNLTQQALARLNEDLEDRVRSRTADVSRSHAALQKTASQLQMAQRISQVGSWELEIATGRVHWSEELFRIVGLDPAQAPPNYEDQAAMFAPESWVKLGQAVTHAIATGESYELQLEIIRPAGDWRWTIARAEATREPGGTVTHLSGTLQDLTELRRVQLELERATDRMRLAARAGALGVWDWSMADNRLIWDETMYQLYGIAPAAFSGAYEAWCSAVHPDDRAAAEAGLQAAVMGEADFDTIFRIIRPDGAVRSIRAAALVHRDQEGKALHMVGINVDITHQRETQLALEQQKLQLERSNRDLEQFAYVASHDLQEPLRAVAGCAQILGRRYTGKLDGAADELIQHIVEGAGRMHTLIQDLLAYSRVSTQREEIAAVDSTVVLRRALANLQTAIKECGATVTIGPLPTVQFAPAQLTQLFQNLLGNALKYRSSRPLEIRVEASRGEREWIFSVHDNGIGIEPKYFERIFVLFQRLHTRIEYPGTGIGLALCKKIVERQGGRIWVESTPGQGTVFYFTIPIGE